MAWTEITRPKYRRDGLRYASDTTEEEWAIIAPHLPEKFRRGRPRTTELRAVVNAVFYIAQTGCQWRLLPKDFPPFTTVQGYFYRWRDEGRWRAINHDLVMRAREAIGREASPTAGAIDSQSVKTCEAGGPRGFDAGKKVKGRKRHIATDTEGHLLGVQGACRRHPGPRRGRRRHRFPPQAVSVAPPSLRRQRLCRREAHGSAPAPRHMDHRDRQAFRCRQGLRAAAPPLGDRAHLRLAQPQPASRQGFRGPGNHRRDLGHDRQRQAHHPAIGENVMQPPRFRVGL